MLLINSRIVIHSINQVIFSLGGVFPLPFPNRVRYRIAIAPTPTPTYLQPTVTHPRHLIWICPFVFLDPL
jgi:hypothetical protein